ncbi:MAG: substrate-binding domain-containing protein [Bacteroidetes bacterium]|nr:substrate-binding domain-containing protein [Bacteroidota bacterium]
MRKQIIIILLVTAAASVIFLIFFSDYNPNRSRTSSSENMTIEVIVKSSDFEGFPFWNVVRQGVETASTDFQIKSTVQGPFTETQIDLQIEMIQEAVKRKPNAIVLAAADYKRLIPVADEVWNAGIPLITIDSFIDSDKPLTRIGTDNYSAGVQAGEALLKLIGTGKKLAIISYVKETSSQINRESGVREKLANDGNIVGTWYSGGNIAISEQQVLQILEDFPEIDGLIALNEQSTVGAARAIEKFSRDRKIYLVGFDNSPAIIQYLEQDIIQTIIVQKPFNMGYLGIKYAIDAIQGKKIPAVIDTEAAVITRENMYTSENQKLLFPVNRN